MYITNDIPTITPQTWVLINLNILFLNNVLFLEKIELYFFI